MPGVQRSVRHPGVKLENKFWGCAPWEEIIEAGMVAVLVSINLQWVR